MRLSRELRGGREGGGIVFIELMLRVWSLAMAC